MQQEYLSNFVIALFSPAAAQKSGSLNAKFKFKETSPTNHFARIDRPIVYCLKDEVDLTSESLCLEIKLLTSKIIYHIVV